MKAAMAAFLISLLMGLLVSVVYGLNGVRSPAPPLIALFGLLGVVLGEQALVMAKAHFSAPSAQHAPKNSRAIDEWQCRSLVSKA